MLRAQGEPSRAHRSTSGEPWARCDRRRFLEPRNAPRRSKHHRSKLFDARCCASRGPGEGVNTRATASGGWRPRGALDSPRKWRPEHAARSMGSPGRYRAPQRATPHVPDRARSPESATGRMIPCCEPRVSLRAPIDPRRANPGRLARAAESSTKLRPEHTARSTGSPGLYRAPQRATTHVSDRARSLESATGRMIPCCEPRVSLRAMVGACRANPGHEAGASLTDAK